MLHEVSLQRWRQFPRSSLVTGDPAMPRSPASTGSRHFPDGSCIVPWPARPSARRYSASLAGAQPSLLSRNPAVAQILQRLSSALRRHPLRAPHPWRTGIAAGNLLVPRSSVAQIPRAPHRAAAAARPLNLIGKGCGGGVSGFREERSRTLERIADYFFHLRLRVPHEVAAGMVQLTREYTGNFARFFPQLVSGVLDGSFRQVLNLSLGFLFVPLRGFE